MGNKISVIVDVATQGADAALKGLDRSFKNVKQSISEADGAAGKFKAGASGAFEGLKANAGVAAVAVGAALFKIGSDSVAAASNLSESINAVNVSYGEAAEGVHKLGEESVESFGLSQRAFNEAAVGFTSFAEDVAGDGGDVAATLDDLMTRSTDFASVMNMDVGEAADAFKSALSGEAEPLKKFGINISDAAVNAHALETGMIAVGESLTDTQKVQARYSLLMKETDKVAGDFANTSDGLANSQKMLKANLENLSATLGQQLAPEVAKNVALFNDLIAAAESVPGPAQSAGSSLFDSFRRAVDPIHAVRSGIADAKGAIEEFTGSEGAATDATDELTTSASALQQAAIDAALGEKRLADETAAAEEATDAHADAIQAHNDGLQEQYDKLHNVTIAFASLRDELSREEGFLNIKNSFDELQIAGQEAWDAAASGAADAEQKADAYRLKQIGVTDEVIDYAEELGTIPPEVVSDIVADINEGSIGEAERTLANLANPGGKARNAFIKTTVQGRGMPEFAGGTNFAPGGAALVGEDGPEIVELPRGSKVHTASASAAMIGSPTPLASGGGSTINITVNAGMGANGKLIGDDIVNALKGYERRNGTGWRA